MKTTSFPDLLDGHTDVELALLTTFAFDPLFFEECLLRKKGLAGARRIAVLADERELNKATGSSQRSPRAYNHRYLVAPMSVRGRGVFHPKIGLLLGNSRAVLICGSANITQAGCTHNLELVNVISIDLSENGLVKVAEGHLGMISQALMFFRDCVATLPAALQAILTEWLDDLAEMLPWWRMINGRIAGPEIRLEHTLKKGLWPVITDWLGSKPADEVTVLSPFYDWDLSLVRRVREAWPKCRLRIIAQQQTSLLPTQLLTKALAVQLHELIGGMGRRLHAKLCVVQQGERALIIAGSANFTRAAFDGNNVEACLIWEGVPEDCEKLFGKGLSIRPIAAENFESGDESSPEDSTEPHQEVPLRIHSAILDNDGVLRIDFAPLAGQQAPVLADVFAPANKNGHEPLASMRLRVGSDGRAEAQWSERIDMGSGSALQIRLRCGDSLGALAWLVQESTLTRHTGGDDVVSARETVLQETGRGLAEHLDELGATQGFASVIAYLERLNIRFHEVRETHLASRSFTVKPHDPFQHDEVAEWLKPEMMNNDSREKLSAALLDFVSRHEKKIVRRHARYPSLAGVKNLLDVVRTCVKLLYVYWERDVLLEAFVIQHSVRILQFLGKGIKSEDEVVVVDGFLAGLVDTFEGDLKLARESLSEQGFFSTAWALLLIAGRVRLDLVRSSEAPPYPLETVREPLLDAFNLLKAKPPTPDELANALNDFELLSEDQVLAWATSI